MHDVTSLDQYLTKYGTLLGQQAQRNLNPLHDPTKEPNHPLIKTLNRKPYRQQAAVITGSVKALRRQKAIFIIGSCGSGKSLMGEATVHCHAEGRPYRALVVAPSQIAKKWRRELLETIPNCYVKIIDRCSDLLPLLEYGPPRCAEWYIIGRDTAKLGPGWVPAAVSRKIEMTTEVQTDEGIERQKQAAEILFCPSCGVALRKTTEKDPVGLIVTREMLSKKRQTCDACRSPLWQMIRKPDRFEPARFVHKKLKGFFDYLVADEIHQNCRVETAQSQAIGSLAAACDKVIALTGTLIGGYAEHLRPLLFRLAPRSLRAEGFKWQDVMAFCEKYGRIETRITESEGGGEDNRQSRGSSTSRTKYCRPGIMPTLFGAHLIGNAVFLGLQELDAALPTLHEYVVGVPMDPELKLAYDRVESVLRQKVKEMAVRRDKRLLGTMLQTLMGYPDHPYGWGDVGYKDKGSFVRVVTPANLDSLIVRPKERKLIDICQQEFCLGRQVWVYVQLNGERNVESRVARLLVAEGLRVKILRQSVPLKDREEWIDANCQEVDVVISHPRLVETGLDLFSKSYLGHNFATLVFYETGYELSVMRQASRRAWRLQQPKECKVYYLFYERTMQQRAMELMGKKLLAAEALEGKFSSEGLVAMAGDDGIEMAMAKSLAENMDESADRGWQEAMGKAATTPHHPRRREVAVIE